MKKNRKITLIAASILICVAALFLAYRTETIQNLIRPNDPGQVLNLDAKGSSKKGTKDLAQSSNRFAFDLYKLYAQEETDKNIFFSPYSISSALAMIYEGAEGETAEEIAQVFYLPKDNQKRHANFAKIHNSLNARDDSYQLNTANAIWPEKTFNIEPNYLDTIGNHYGGKIEALDYKKKAESSRKTINNWVEQKTQDKIKDLLPKGSIDKYTRLVLTNAIYFKGDWKNQFEKSDTQKKTFYLNEDETIRVDMMNRSSDKTKFNFLSEDGLKVIELPYKGGDLSMFIFLPDLGKMQNFEKDFTIDKLASYKEELKKTEVGISLPKFEIKTKYNMNEDLSTLGMPTALTDQADFSGLSAKAGDEIFLSNVFHQAYIKLNEEGTEAAAATGGTIGLDYVTVNPSFFADRPFVFLIQDKETDQILFMGKIVDPR